MPEPGSEPLIPMPADRSGAGITGASPDYVIGPEDVVEIEVFDVPELKKKVRVSNDGMIGLALIGRVKAAGLTVDQLREQLEARYRESYLQDPQISVFIADYKGQSVSVIGAVEKPGIYQLTARRTLIEILSMAGGLAKRSSAPAGRTLIVTRKGGFGDLPVVEGMRFLSDERLEIEIRGLLYSQESGLNIEVRPSDTISVARADLVYVVGDVKRPTGILMEDRDDLTVLQAIAVAEGLNRTASRKKARILRRNEDGSKTEIPVNLGDVLSGKAPDLTLAANDVLFVPDSRGKVMVQRGLETAAATISGVIIWRQAR
jgi:polysaccharide export outer membrane protein